MGENIDQNNVVPTENPVNTDSVQAVPVPEAPAAETPVPTPAPMPSPEPVTAPAPGPIPAPVPGPVPTPTPVSEPAPKKSKKGLLIGIIAAAVVVIAAIVVVLIVVVLPKLKGGAKTSSKNTSDALCISAWFNTDGTGFIVNEKGDVVSFSANDPLVAKLTADRNHIVLIEETGIKVMNAKGEELFSKKVADDISDYSYDIANKSAIILADTSINASWTVEEIKNKIIEDYNKAYPSSKITKTEFDSYYTKQKFKDTISSAKECYEINLDKEFDDVYPPKYRTTILYADYTANEVVEIDLDESINSYYLSEEEDGAFYYSTSDAIYCIKPNSGDAEKVQNIKHNEVDFLYVGHDIAVWADYEEYDEATVYVYANGDVNSFGKFDENNYSTVIFSPDYSNMIVLVEDSEYFLYGPVSGSSTEKIHLKEELCSTSVYDVNGSLSDGDTTKENGIYVKIGDDNTLCYVTFDGNREKVSSDIDSVTAIKAGKLIYTTVDDELKVGTLKGGNLENVSKIASDVFSASANDLGYIIYTKDVDDYDDWYDGATLFEAPNWGETTNKIASNTSAFTRISKTKAECVYYQDYKEIDGTYLDYETYYIYDGKEKGKVGQDILSLNLFESGQYDKFLFIQYDRVDKKTGDVIGNLYYYDGKEATKIATDIVYRAGAVKTASPS